MNEVIKTILERRSVRSYEKTPVKHEDIELLVKCAMFAPTGMARQPWHFTAVERVDVLDKISEMNKKVLLDQPEGFLRAQAEKPDFNVFRGAPAVIFISSGDEGINTIADCANAAENIVLAAHSLGLSTCYVAMFKYSLELEEGREYFKEIGVPEGYTPHFAICIGYGNETLGDRAPRKENIVNYVR